MMEKINNLLFKNSYSLHFIIFLYLVFVFVNFTHNSFNEYKKVDFPLYEGNEEIFIKKNNIKFEISKILSSDETYSIFFDRSCEVTGNLHDRHRVRWIKALTLKYIFQTSYHLNNKLPYYVNIILHSILLFFTLVCKNFNQYCFKTSSGLYLYL